MRSRSTWAVGSLVSLAALATIGSGCGSRTPYLVGSTEQATVKGTVKVRGKLVDGGELHFNASNPNRKVDTRNATVGKDGTYTVQAYVGLNVVSLTPPKARNKAQSREFFGVEYDEKGINVRSGENTVDLEFLP
jgi:hypothetical protein